MGTIAARKAMEILKNARKVVAMELMAACQAIDLRGKEKLGKGTEVAYRTLRQEVRELNEDRIMYLDINKSEDLIRTNVILDEVEAAIGKLE
jgi:histidine ammonia-lyase